MILELVRSSYLKFNQAENVLEKEKHPFLRCLGKLPRDSMTDFDALNEYLSQAGLGSAIWCDSQ